MDLSEFLAQVVSTTAPLKLPKGNGLADCFVIFLGEVTEKQTRIDTPYVVPKELKKFKCETGSIGKGSKKPWAPARVRLVGLHSLGRPAIVWRSIQATVIVTVAAVAVVLRYVGMNMG